MDSFELRQSDGSAEFGLIPFHYHPGFYGTNSVKWVEFIADEILELTVVCE